MANSNSKRLRALLIFPLLTALLLCVWWIVSEDTCLFCATAEFTSPSIDETKILQTLGDIPGVIPHRVTIDGPNITVSGTVSRYRWESDPGPKIRPALLDLGFEEVNVSGYY